jgi:hypothetical protein
VVVCWQKAEETRARHFPNIGTIDLRIDYLRPGRGQHSVATGRVGRLGGRVAVAHMELVNDTDEQIAAGSACLHRRLTTGFEGFAQQSWPEMGPLPKLFEDIDLPLWSEIFCGVVLHVGGIAKMNYRA